MDVGVIGAGIIGLSTAVAIQERSSIAYRVTILADKFASHTTSWGAGGQIVPICPPGIPQDVGKKWCDDSADYFYGLAFSSEAASAGVNLLSGFHLTNNDHAPNSITYKCFNVKQMAPEDLKRFGVVFKNGYTATSVVVEMPVYLEWLMKKFLDRGGQVLKAHVQSLEDLSGQYDALVNCTGLGSRQLVNDRTMVAVRGQTVHVKAPWIKNFVRVDATMHVFPLRDSVFVGSVKQDGNEDMTISASDTERMLKRAQEVFPPLKGAPVLWEWVGFRPHRDKIRLEQETRTTKQGKQFKVVHNYGHGSFGISLSWGTALHVSDLVDGILKQGKSPSKL